MPRFFSRGLNWMGHNDFNILKKNHLKCDLDLVQSIQSKQQKSIMSISGGDTCSMWSADNRKAFYFLSSIFLFFSVAFAILFNFSICKLTFSINSNGLFYCKTFSLFHNSIHCLFVFFSVAPDFSFGFHVKVQNEILLLEILLLAFFRILIDGI